MTLTTSPTSTIDDFLAGQIDLCSPPEILTRITQALDDPIKNAGDIAYVIEHDPSLTIRMLKIVNSAFFGFPATVKSVEHAISILGNNEIRSLVMATSMVEKFSNMPDVGIDIRAFWQHSLKTALFAKFLSDNHPKKRQLSSAFISGLLHDIGKLVIYIKAPELVQAASLMAKTKNISEPNAEKSILGFNHAEIGGALLTLWKIPEPIQSSAAFHHQPELAVKHQDEVNIVYIANKLAHADLTSEESLQQEVPPENIAWGKLGMPYGIISVVADEVQEHFERTYALFFNA